LHVVGHLSPLPSSLAWQQGAFKALEFWPANFQTTGGVIVRRDVAYAEQNDTTAHRYTDGH